MTNCCLLGWRASGLVFRPLLFFSLTTTVLPSPRVAQGFQAVQLTQPMSAQQITTELARQGVQVGRGLR